MEELKGQGVSETPQDKEQDVKHYDFGHLVLNCGRCNSKYIIEEDVPGNQARQIVLAPTSTSGIMLECKDCKNRMSLFFIESTKKKDETTGPITDNIEKPTEEVKEGSKDESVSEEGSVEESAV